jgi:hypothetical protein
VPPNLVNPDVLENPLFTAKLARFAPADQEER